MEDVNRKADTGVEMNIICEKTDCKHNKENNPMQELPTCHKETVRVNKRGFCQSKEKKL